MSWHQSDLNGVGVLEEGKDKVAGARRRSGVEFYALALEALWGENEKRLRRRLGDRTGLPLIFLCSQRLGGWAMMSPALPPWSIEIIGLGGILRITP